jgi:hypothetical protein
VWLLRQNNKKEAEPHTEKQTSVLLGQLQLYILQEEI